MRPGRLAPTLRRLRKAARSPRETASTLQAALVLVVVEALIRWVTLPRLSRILGVRFELTSPSSDARPISPNELSPLARRKLRSADRVTQVWPLSQGPCLRRALVAGHLLRHLDPALRLGMTGAGEELIAHAWLEIEGRPLEDVVGFTVFQRSEAVR